MPNAVGIDAAWAVGSGTITWPQGTAYAIGGYKQALQMHYSNYLQVAGQVDIRSGIKLKLTSTKPTNTIDNIIIRPVNNQDFVKSLSTCSGVICGAGFETPAEALFLKKKLLVIPMKGQFEQQCIV